MPRENLIAALIHNRLGPILQGVFTRGVDANHPFQIGVDDTNDRTPLVTQLTGPTTAHRPSRSDSPWTSSAAFPMACWTRSRRAGRSPAPRGTALRDKVRDALGQLTLFGGQDAIADLIAARDLSSLRGVAESLFGRVRGAFGNDSEGAAAGGAVERLRQLLGDDVGIALPFATLLGAVQGGLRNAVTVPGRVEHALLSYFFAPAGFETVDGEHIVSPVHLSDIRGAIGGIGAVADLGICSSSASFRRRRPSAISGTSSGWSSRAPSMRPEVSGSDSTAPGRRWRRRPPRRNRRRGSWRSSSPGSRDSRPWPSPG